MVPGRRVHPLIDCLDGRRIENRRAGDNSDIVDAAILSHDDFENNGALQVSSLGDLGVVGLHSLYELQSNEVALNDRNVVRCAGSVAGKLELSA